MRPRLGSRPGRPPGADTAGTHTSRLHSCRDQFRQTVFYEPPQDKRAPAAQRLGDRTGSSALSASATTARATATADGRFGAATPTTQMIPPAVCALRTLAFLLDAAGSALPGRHRGGQGGPHRLHRAGMAGHQLDLRYRLVQQHGETADHWAPGGQC